MSRKRFAAGQRTFAEFLAYSGLRLGEGERSSVA